jgi:transposase
VPAIPSWLLEPLWDQFAALLPDRPLYDPSHPLGCHKPRTGDRIIFEKLIQVLRFGCSYASIADCTCGATTIRDRRDEWIEAGIFGKLKTIARESYDRIVAWSWTTWPSTGASLRPPVAGNAPAAAPSTAASWA